MVNDYIGVDGDYLNRNLLMINDKNFLAVDLTCAFYLPKKYDNAISLEVAGHLPEMSVGPFIQTFVSLSDSIIFQLRSKVREVKITLTSNFLRIGKISLDNNYIVAHNFSKDI